jgi:hypothetical protein
MSKDNNTDLHGAFGDKGTKSTQIDYSHPNSKEILDEVKKVLNHCPTGYALLAVADAYDFTIRILKGRGEPGFSPDTKISYIHVPIKQQNSKPKQCIDLVKAIRLGEQDILGFTAPDPTKDMLNYASVIHAKNLDSIAFACKLVYELRDSSFFSDLLDEIKNLGHYNVYKAYASEASKEELAEVYLEEEREG